MRVRGSEKLQDAPPVGDLSDRSEVPAVREPENSSSVVFSTDFLKDFLTRFVSDPLAGILRRVEFFAPREPLAKDGAPDLDAVPLQASCSCLTVSPTSLYFSDTRIGSSSSDRYFTISNPNDYPLSYSLLGVPYGFNVSSSSGTVPANGSVSITVTFTPYYAQNYSGYINISPGSNSVAVSGRGVK